MKRYSNEDTSGLILNTKFYNIIFSQNGYSEKNRSDKKYLVSLVQRVNMFAPRNRHNKRKIIILVCVIICLYVTLFSPYSNYEYQEIIKNVKPEQVWEFVADFSKMKTLIPNMLEFKITADHGNNDDWKYSVDYLEKLSHWPYWKNNAVAHYSVKSKFENGKMNYIVDSKHKTCFFGVYCGKTFKILNYS